MAGAAAQTRLQTPLAVTLGDPAGVGPEIVAQLFTRREELDLPPFITIGPAKSLTGINTAVIAADADLPAAASADTLGVIDCPSTTAITAGHPDINHGDAVLQSLEMAAKLAEGGLVSGIVTMPIHKANLRRAGFSAPGHTEYFARKAGLQDDDVVMMLTGGGLRVVPVTIHIALAGVASALRTDDIVKKTAITADALRDQFNIETPRIAIAALNPHGGEGGLMGGEEATHIQPAIWALQDMGLTVFGPEPADTLFHSDARERYDAVICMYHDQALIPLKTLDFWGGVNVTLGLPFVRTSPDHGTAYDIAGKGTARIDSSLAALRMAGDLALARA